MLAVGKSHSVCMRCCECGTGGGQMDIRWTLPVRAAPILADPHISKLKKDKLAM